MNVRALFAVSALAFSGACVSAQTPAAPKAPTAAAASETAIVRPSGRPERDTLRKLMRPMTLAYSENRLEDVITSIKDVTDADIEVMWADDRVADGLDKEAKITLDVKGRTALSVLEEVLEITGRDGLSTGGNTWQMNDTGTIQIGPRSRLNKFRTIVIYSIADLLIDVPNYQNAPEFDLQTVLQSNQGGGGQSPFTENNEQGNDRRTVAEKGQEIVDILTQLVEPEQWLDNGGDSASMRFFQGSLIVNAPDYVHRGLVGYSYWPSSGTRVSTAKGRRYVTIGTQTTTSQISGIAKDPVIVPDP